MIRALTGRLFVLLIIVFIQSGCSSNTSRNPHSDVLFDVPTPVPGNPIITDKFTADPAAIVYKDTVYLYVGHDEAPPNTFYDLNEWLVYSSTNMVDWQEHPVPLRATDFSWAIDDAWASEVIERDGKFYWYVTVQHNEDHHGKAIGVAVSDSPLGPFKDARGSALITNDMTEDVNISWDDIDPTVWIEENGQAYLFWGNTQLYWAKLKDNMIELEGEIQRINLPKFTEAPYIHKKGDYYYLSYAYDFPEKTAYAMSDNIEGPWYFKGILNEVAGHSNTNHQSIINYKGKDYFIYHNGSFPTTGDSFRRSVCIDYLYYNPDGTLKRIVMTTEGVSAAE